VKSTETQLSPEYVAALAEHSLALRTFAAAVAKFRTSQSGGYQEFAAAKRAMNAADTVFDASFSAERSL
jgi:hypothetical protein